MIMIKKTNVECPHCRRCAPQRIVQQPGQEPLLWCEVCFRVTILHSNLSVLIDPLALLPVLNVHVAELDADHERLIDLLNELHTTAKAGQRDQLKEIIDRLLDELKAHLDREESLLAEWGFAGLEEHQGQHTAMHERMHTLAGRLLAGTHDIVDVGRLMKFCLVGHLAEDMKYKEFLAERRGAPDWIK